MSRSWSRCRPGNYPVKTVNLCQMLKEVTGTYAVVPGRDVKINVIPAEGCLVRANDLLKDVFDNLVDNAIRHSTGPLTVDISIEPALEDGRKYYMVSVADNGPGIHRRPEEKNFQVHRYRHRKPWPQGTGALHGPDAGRKLQWQSMGRRPHPWRLPQRQPVRRTPPCR